MGRLYTLANLREDVRQRYDLPTFSTTGWCTTSAVNRHLNESVQRFTAVLAEAYGDNYLLTSSTITTTADVNVSSLPSDFYKLARLSWRKDATTAVPIKRGTVDDLMRASLDSCEWTRPRYVLTASTITWCTVPNQAYTVDVWYQALLPDLSADGDTIDCGPGWAEWICLDVCRKLAAREQKDPSVWLAEQQMAEQLLRSQAADRNEGESLGIRDALYGRDSSLGDQERRDLLTLGDG